MPRTTRTRLTAAAFSAVVASAVSALFLLPPASADETAATADAMAHATALSKAFRHAAEHATPSVVVVRSEAKAKPAAARDRQRRGGGGENPFKGTPFEDFFKDGLPEGFEFGPHGGMPPRSGVGSGVIV
ncbi:MAG: hypothetical protein ACKOBP_10240, partial [Planctomycetia bacterium]